MVLAVETQAAPVKRLFQNVKLPSQAVLEKQTFNNLVASNSTIASDKDGPSSAAVATLTTFDTTIDAPRNLEITPKGVTGDIETCVITVAGTNFLNRSITEDFSFASNATGKQIGSKAFKTITSVTWPANCESGAFGTKWSIGAGEKIGLNYCMDDAGDIGWSLLNGSKEATAPTMAVDADEVEKNTADFLGTMNGSNDFKLRYIQNFGCY